MNAFKLWLYETFAWRKRLYQSGMPEWPYFYRKGTNQIIMRAPGYLTPKKLLWVCAILDFVRGLAKLALILSVIAITVAVVYEIDPHDLDDLPKRTGDYVLIAAFMSPFILWKTRPSKYGKIARFWCSTATTVRLTPKKIVVSGGLCGHKRFHNNPDITLSSRIEPHDQTRSETLNLQLSANPSQRNKRQRRVAVYDQSFYIDLIYGSMVIRVAEVFGKFDAESFSTGLQIADQLHKRLLWEQEQQAAKQYGVDGEKLVSVTSFIQ